MLRPKTQYAGTETGAIVTSAATQAIEPCGVRTFITAMAGVGRMDLRTYVVYSTIGGALWATGVTLAGYYLGTIPFVKDHIELILIGIVGLSIIPIMIEAVRHRREARTAGALEQG